MAAFHIRETDHARRRFVRTRFGQDIDDPHIYDLVINRDRMTSAAVARLIVESPRNRRIDQAGGSLPQAGEAGLHESGPQRVGGRLEVRAVGA
jgi:Cytidylate kinase-like family